MDFASEKYQKELKRIKENIRESYHYFEKNYKRFNDFRKMVFESSLTENDRQLLRALERPALEFNILEPYISRVLGEIYQQKPAVKVTSNNHDNANPAVNQFIEAHLRSVFEDRTNKHKIYEMAKDILSGGFSAAHVDTDYTSEMSMQQMINFDRVFDPTLCGWDPVSRYSHKGDGSYCFEMIPKTKEEMKEIYPKINTERFTYSTNIEGFKWSYRSGKRELVLIVDYYEKKKRRKKIVELSDKRIMFNDKWKKEKLEWEGIGEGVALLVGIVVPTVVKERFTVVESICRYRVCESKVLEYEETDYKHLPIVFLDGNSIMIRPTEGGDMQQVTRPYVYHAKGAQRLKNASGIALANEIESTVQHKFMIKEEALPHQPEYIKAWKQYNKPSLMVYKGYLDDNPDQPIENAVSPVPRIGAPAEITNAFIGADSLVQNILGSYDAALGINDNQLSGVAIKEGAKQSNSAVMPYIVGLMHGLQRIAQIYVALIPKYYRTPITLPYIDDNGDRKYVKLSKTDDVLNYDDNVLNVSVEAGPSFRVQKEHTLMMVKELMGVSELFAQFVNEKGLDFILDNLEGYGIDRLKQLVTVWNKERDQKMESQPNPQQMEMQLNQQKMQVEQEKMADERQKIAMNHQNDLLKMEQVEQKQKTDSYIAQQKNATEIQRQEEKQQLEEMKIQLAHFEKMMDLRIKEVELANKINFADSKGELKDETREL